MSPPHRHRNQLRRETELGQNHTARRCQKRHLGPGISCRFSDISILPLPGLLPRCQVGIGRPILGPLSSASGEEMDRCSEGQTQQAGSGRVAQSTGHPAAPLGQRQRPPQPHREGTGKMDPQEQTAPEHGWWEITRLFHEAAKILSSPPTKVSQGKVVSSLNHDSGATITQHNCWGFEASRGLKGHYVVTTGVCLCHKDHQDMEPENPLY